MAFIEDSQVDNNFGNGGDGLDEGKANWRLEVTDLKQYCYCPRVVFYHYCLPQVRPVTYKMTHGIQAHQEEARREARRSLQIYGLPQGERLVDKYLTEPTLGNTWDARDLVIAVPNLAQAQELIPVEYKWSNRTPGPHFRLQLAAYAYLLENNLMVPVKRGFIFQPPLRKVTEITITPALRRQVKASVEHIKELVTKAKLPSPPKKVAPCVNCEFRRICNDTL